MTKAYNVVLLEESDISRGPNAMLRANIVCANTKTRSVLALKVQKEKVGIAL